MAGESGSVGAGNDSGASSPRNKIKFLCSHGGKILPRPGDGVLKYVGGETRVIAVPRDITFSEFMKKVTALTDGDMILKYQLVPEDLDALVSVRSDADLQHMFDEYDRHVGSAPMLRAFLFPSKPIVLENQAAVSEPQMLEQRYIDAINGIAHTGPGARLRPIRAVRAVSSACSSPKSISPDGHSADVTHESFFRNKPASMHKVRSSPSFSSLNNLLGTQNTPQYDHSHYHHLQHHPHGLAPVRLSHDPQTGIGYGRPPTMSSLPRQDSGRANGLNQYYPVSRQNSHKGSAGCSKCGHYDESSPNVHARLERNNSASRPPSPRQTTIWEY